MSKKRSVGELWACVCCSLTLEDNIVPAVMQCSPFAHTICTACADDLLEKGDAKCPQCRTPFAFVRPLAEFVDTDDVNVASALAKKAKTKETLEDRLQQVLQSIDNDTVRQRVKHLATKVVEAVDFMIKRNFASCIHGGGDVPEFDKSNVRIRVKGRRSRTELQRSMEGVTSAVLQYVQPLFPHLVIKPYSNAQKPTRYMWCRIQKRD